MDLGLAGRVAVVAASTSGLGEAVARALAAEGARVVICGRRLPRARQIAAELPEAIAVEVDITMAGGPEHLVDAAHAAFGGVDVAVLNGPGPKPGTAESISPDDVTSAIMALVVPHQRLVSLVLPSMRERGWGRILAIGSSGVATPLPNLALSNLGRAALAAYLKTLASEVAGVGVTVNLLLPGRIATDRTAELDQATASRTGLSVAAVVAQACSTIPAGRYGNPSEFGAAAAFLCSDMASYITGVALRCDGGRVSTL